MRIHYIQHVPFEDLANIDSWAGFRGHDLSRTLLFSDEKLPEMDHFDWLIIMGGPMNIYEDEKYPWLAREKEFIRQAIASDKIVLGICLGAQLIADVLGSSVRKNEYREIGWFPVSLTEEGISSPIFSVLPDRFVALHWHGDTFGIPPGAVRIAESRACKNQAFIKGKAIGLQFHLESSRDSIDHLLENCADELTEGPFVQSQKDLSAHPERLSQIQDLMEKLLDRVEEVLGPEKVAS
ncbi:MAG: type 1 glutamine amidotransferase [Methanothrix sp.]|nr:type 1 glutamine amidotransferase [Methanothrix sp.]